MANTLGVLLKSIAIILAFTIIEIKTFYSLDYMGHHYRYFEGCLNFLLMGVF